GNGDGTFRGYRGYTSGGNGWAAAFVDANRDGKLDILVSNNGNSLGFLQGTGEGTFSSVKLFEDKDHYFLFFAVGDLNGDGGPDVAGAYGAIAGTGLGTFVPGTIFQRQQGTAWRVVLGDLNGDGRLDLLVANHLDSDISVFLNRSK